MIRLASSSTKLQAVLAGAVTTNQCHVTVCYSDHTSTGYAGGTQVTVTNSTTAVDICAAPSGSDIRDIDYVAVRNRDTVAATVTVMLDISATDTEIVKAALATGETLNYTHADGWRVLTAAGEVKTSGGSSVSLTQGKLAGRGASSGTGAIEEITVSTGLSLTGTTLTATGGTAATQAEMEAASSTSVYVSPGRIKYSPNVAKAWAKFQGISTVAIFDSVNVSSITDHGVGNYTVVWDTDFSTAAYAFLGTVLGPAATISVLCEDPDTVDHTTTSVRIYTANSSTAGVVDCRAVSCVAYGDFA